jgi:cyclic-di-AMP phosphodiesterase PgpH
VIHRNRLDTAPFWQALRTPHRLRAIGIAAAFWVLACSITTLRERMVRVRPEQYVHEDVLSRVDFTAMDDEELLRLKQQARDAAPSVYRVGVADTLAAMESRLLVLPEDAANRLPGQSSSFPALDSGTVTALRQIHNESPEEYKGWVRKYIGDLRKARDQGRLVMLPLEDRLKDLQRLERRKAKLAGNAPGSDMLSVDLSRTYGRKSGEPMGALERVELLNLVGSMADVSFPPSISAGIAGLTVETLGPTHELDRDLTTVEQNDAAEHVSTAPARRHVLENTILVPRGTVVTPAAWKLLAAEQRAYIEQLPMGDRLLSHAGMMTIILLITVSLSLYTAFFQPRVVQNHARAVALGALLLAMLLVAQLAGIGTVPLLVFGAAPTILVAMILAIAYDQRFALGIATLHGMLVSAALDQGIGFFVVLWVGALACCFMLDEVRTRGKLVEVGGATALGMMVAAAAVGAVSLDPLLVIGRSGLFAGAAGLGVGFVVLGILPFIEKTFRITTSMTLLELADASQPLLRRLALEAPGTYNHSLQVATLAEAAAEAIGANSLLCRVGSYYHDIGKMNKAEYFCENQFDGRNRHLSLNPNVSLLIIMGHVKDGGELAKEYNLPSVLVPFILEHHGTTVMEYFYHQARCQQDAAPASAAPISDAQYRYAGPRPRNREIAVVMIADAVESAARSMTEPTAGRIETLVHELIMRRLLDGQFDESDLTFRDLEQVEEALIKTVLGIYHGRLTYPSTAATTQGPSSPTAKSA